MKLPCPIRRNLEAGGLVVALSDSDQELREKDKGLTSSAHEQERCLRALGAARCNAQFDVSRRRVRCTNLVRGHKSYPQQKDRFGLP